MSPQFIMDYYNIIINYCTFFIGIYQPEPAPPAPPQVSTQNAAAYGI